MHIRPRVIPTLLISEGNLVKTKKFDNPNYLGDPINAVKIFNEKNVDELCVLDVCASKKGGSPDMDLIKDMASEAFMPMSYGGGIKSINQMREIFSLGFEKIIVNTLLVEKPELIKEATAYFGSQSIVASIDYKTFLGKKICYIKDGTQKTSYSPMELIKTAESLGVGEVLLYSIDRDGQKKGYDNRMISEAVANTSIPIIACGGAGSVDDIAECLDVTGVHAVAAGSLFVYFGSRDAVLINYPDETAFINKNIYREVFKNE